MLHSNPQNVKIVQSGYTFYMGTCIVAGAAPSLLRSALRWYPRGVCCRIPSPCRTPALPAQSSPGPPRCRQAQAHSLRTDRLGGCCDVVSISPYRQSKAYTMGTLTEMDAAV